MSHPIPNPPDAELFGLLYGELRGMAEKAMVGQPAGHTLQPTALVHEAFMKVMGAEEPPFADRIHFLSVAACVMRHLLVDHARKKNCGKRTAIGVRVDLESVFDSFEESAEDLEALDYYLEKLAVSDPPMALAIELRFFGGASVEEAAEAVGIPVRTMERKWKVVRLYLRSKMRAR